MWLATPASWGSTRTAQSIVYEGTILSGRPLVATYGRRLVKLTGDGDLIEFTSGVDASSAALEFQWAMAGARMTSRQLAARAVRRAQFAVACSTPKKRYGSAPPSVAPPSAIWRALGV